MESQITANSLLHCCGSGTIIFLYGSGSRSTKDGQFFAGVQRATERKNRRREKRLFVCLEVPSPSPLLACVYVTCGLWADRKLNSHTRYDISIILFICVGLTLLFLADLFYSKIYLMKLRDGKVEGVLGDGRGIVL